MKDKLYFLCYAEVIILVLRTVAKAMLIYNKKNQIITEDEIRLPQNDEVVWIRMLKPSEAEVKYVLEDLFQCHPLLVEDCITMKQRPRSIGIKTKP